MSHTALAVAAALVAVAFACTTFERWLAKGRRHELAWSIALGFFAVAAFALAAGSQLGWTPAVFRVFYLFGAIVNVPFLALGTVYLLAGERRGDRVAAGVALFAAFAAGVVLTTPLTAALPDDALARGSEVFDPLPRVLAAVASGVGALVIFGGALWSAFRYRRGRLLAANALIAAGTALLSASGLLNSVLDEMDAFAVALVAGIIVLFAGFLVASSAGGAPVARTSGASQARPGPPSMTATRDATVSRPNRAVARVRR